MMRKTITRKWLESNGACTASVKWFDAQNTTDIETLYKLASEENRYSDINWTITKLMTKVQRVRYAVYAAKKVLPIFEKKYPEDKRPRDAIIYSSRYLRDGKKNDFSSAAATVAYCSATAAYLAAYYAAYAAYCAADSDAAAAADAAAYAADAAAYCAADSDAADAAADAAACAADAAAYAVAYAADAAATAADAAVYVNNTSTCRSIIKYGWRILHEKGKGA